MRFFHKLAQNVAVAQALHAVWRHPELWNQHRFRTTYEGTPHGEVDDIWLRFSDACLIDAGGPNAVVDDEACVWYPAAGVLPEMKPLVLDVMKFVGAYELNRLLITRLKPGARIPEHADNYGAYGEASDRARYHLVLQGLPGSMYRNGDEEVAMLSGELWTFTPREVHEIYNNSLDDRIHLIIDVRIWP